MDHPVAAPIPVLILNWNGWDDTLRCLASLGDARDARDVWVVDNGSEEDRSAQLTDAHPGVRIVRLDRNYGWAGGYNRALRLAADEGHRQAYLLNNDTVVHPRFLSEIRAALARVSSPWGAIGSRILHPDGSIQFDGQAYHPPGESTEPPDSEPLQHVESVNGSGMLINLRAWEAVGPFEEAFFCYHEEYEWCLRAAHRNHPCFLAPRSRLYHDEGGSDVNASAAYYRGRNRYLLATLRPDAASTESRARISFSLCRRAAEARRASRDDLWAANLQALRDGLGGRFGKRTEWRPALPFTLATLLWPRPLETLRRRLRRGA